jgi:O-antigen/teichoic acid export membrane protein
MTLRENFVWNFTGRAVYAVCQWGILIAIAKMGSPEMVGKFGLALAITAPIFALASMDLRSLVASDVIEQHKFNQYYTVRQSTNFLAFALTSILSIVFDYSAELVAIIMVIGIARSFEGTSDVLFGLMQKNERMDYIAKSSVLKGVFSIAGIALIMYLTRSLLWAVLFMAGVWGALLLLYDVPNARRLAKSSDIPKLTWYHPGLKKILCLALPLGIAAALNSLNTNIPRYLIEQYHGPSVLGYFVALSYILLVGDNITNTLGQAAIAPLARNYRDDLPRFYRLMIRLMLVGFAIGVVGILIAALFGRPLLTILYTADYAEHVNAFIFLMTAGLAIYVLSFVSYAMIAIRFIKAQAAISVIVVAGCLVAGLLLIPRYGLLGAAWATLITFALKLFLSTLLVGFFLRRQARIQAAQ